jgi:hypothetical protein
MTFKSKRTIASLGTGVIILVAYVIYATSKSAPASGNMKAWAIALLIFVGIGIIAVIVIQILFHILSAIGLAVKEHTQGRAPDEYVERALSSEMVDDEMEKLITLKASRIGSWLAGFGVIAFLFALGFGAPPVLALHLVVGAFALSGLAEGIASIYLYERGV